MIEKEFQISSKNMTDLHLFSFKINGFGSDGHNYNSFLGFIASYQKAEQRFQNSYDSQIFDKNIFEEIAKQQPLISWQRGVFINDCRLTPNGEVYLPFLHIPLYCDELTFLRKYDFQYSPIIRLVRTPQSQLRIKVFCEIIGMNTKKKLKQICKEKNHKQVATSKNHKLSQLTNENKVKVKVVRKHKRKRKDYISQIIQYLEPL